MLAGIEKHLQVGQSVRLKEHGHGYQVAVLASDEAGPKVAEVGPDYVVFDNTAADVKTRIPVHLLALVAPEALVSPPETAAPQTVPQAA